jgi:hypothetical protein
MTRWRVFGKYGEQDGPRDSAPSVHVESGGPPQTGTTDGSGDDHRNDDT